MLILALCLLALVFINGGLIIPRALPARATSCPLPDVNAGTQSAYWKLDEGTGTTTADATGNGNTGTLSTSAPSWITGPFVYPTDHALTFNGIDQYVNVGTLGNFGSTHLSQNTFELWYKTTSTAKFEFFGGIQNSGGTQEQLSLAANINQLVSTAVGKLTLAVISPGSKILTAATTSAIPTLSDGNWHHIAVTLNTSTDTVQIYFDGVSQAVTYGFTQVLNPFSDFTAPFYLGAGYKLSTNSAVDLFNGSMDNVVFHNSILSAGDILAASQSLSCGLTNTVDVSATIDPTISFSLDTNNCNFGSLTSATVKACPVGVSISTNGTGGYVAYIKDANNGTLNSASDMIAAVASSPLAAGTEGFGVATSRGDQAMVQESGCTNGASVNSQAITTSNQAFASASSPVDSDASTVCLAAGITDLTPAGAYADSAYITVVGNF